MAEWVYWLCAFWCWLLSWPAWDSVIAHRAMLAMAALFLVVSWLSEPVSADRPEA